MKGIQNKADYFSKHHSLTHHQAVRSAFLYEAAATGKNYFELLQDTDTDQNDMDDDVTTPTTASDRSDASTSYSSPECGEGVLNTDPASVLSARKQATTVFAKPQTDRIDEAKCQQTSKS